MLAVLGVTLPSATLVGLAGGAGAAIGEITGYVVGHTGRTLVKKQKTYDRMAGWVKKWGTLTIFIASTIPFVFDLVGIAAGALRIPAWKFLLASWAGRTLLYILIAQAGAHGWVALLKLFS